MDKARIPRWVRALWGAGLVALNVFLVVYVIGFTAAVASITGGFGQSWVARSFLQDERAFGGLFVIVAFAVLLSFAYMGLSILHAVAWSDLSNNQKLVWAAVLFAGAQPAALVYWYMHVWQRGSPVRRLGEERKPHAQWPRPWLVVLGVLTITPVLYMFGFFSIVGVGMATSFGGSSNEPAFISYLPIAHLGVIVLCWALTAFYLVDVFRNPRLEGNRPLWALIVAFAGFVGWPIYWYLNMWRTPAMAPADVDSGMGREQAHPADGQDVVG